MNAVASDVVYWIGTAFMLISFGIAVALNFTSEKVSKVLNWVLMGTSLVSIGCYWAFKILIG